MKSSGHKNRFIHRIATLLVVTFSCCALTAVAFGVGDATDPLITLSYLNEIFLPDVLRQANEKIDARNDALLAELSAMTEDEEDTTGFVFVTLLRGQKLTVSSGGELLPRSGTVQCAAVSSPGLIDETEGKTVDNGGELQNNHLYLVPAGGHGITTDSDIATVFVRGDYEIA